MREALARVDHDFVLSEPRRKSPKRPSVFGFLRKPKLAVLFAAKHANLLIGLIFAGLLGVVMVNALVWQKSPHPAPLFSHLMPVEASVEQKAPDAKSETVAAPVSHTATSTAPVAPATEKAASTPHGRDPMAEVAQLQVQKPAPAHDPIAQLLKSPASAEPKSTEAKPAESSKSILAAQHALMKLGYVVKPDGATGPAFRQALEQFERDRGLPVHGALSPKVMHELTAQSGITVD